MTVLLERPSPVRVPVRVTRADEPERESAGALVPACAPAGSVPGPERGRRVPAGSPFASSPVVRALESVSFAPFPHREGTPPERGPAGSDDADAVEPVRTRTPEPEGESELSTLDFLSEIVLDEAPAGVADDTSPVDPVSDEEGSPEPEPEPELVPSEARSIVPIVVEGWRRQGRPVDLVLDKPGATARPPSPASGPVARRSLGGTPSPWAERTAPVPAPPASVTDEVSRVASPETEPTTNEASRPRPGPGARTMPAPRASGPPGVDDVAGDGTGDGTGVARTVDTAAPREAAAGSMTAASDAPAGSRTGP